MVEVTWLTRYNVFIAGVGGQGLLTLGRLLGYAAIEAGYDVTVAEVHGLSQRGGTLNVHVRIGSGEAPVIPTGGSNLFIALEALEAIRYSKFIGKDTTVVINDFLWPPPLSKYPSMEEILNKLRVLNNKVYVVDANAISKKIIGNIISSNIAIMGFSYAVDHGLKNRVKYECIERALEKIFRGKALELNKMVLREGFEEGLKRLG
uniref:Pyruvate ferredoxin oxidoreductase n=1 Tax=Staphylothermus marinus TaxID=2280 RepID=A0A7C4NLP8_STAMA